MAKKFPKAPSHPERLCWGCDTYCPASDMRCGNGSDRTPHPAELFGDDWDSWELDDVGSAQDGTHSDEPKRTPSCAPNAT